MNLLSTTILTNPTKSQNNYPTKCGMNEEHFVTYNCYPVESQNNYPTKCGMNKMDLEFIKKSKASQNNYPTKCGMNVFKLK